jgi:hypothetical protein
MSDGIWLAGELFGGINVFKKGYHARAHFVKDEKHDLHVYSHSMSDRSKNHFCKLLNVHGCSLD